MDINIFAAVMLAAVLHPAWNGMVKKHKDKVISVSAIVFGHVPMAFVVMLFMPLPTLESVPYIILSAIIHQGYQVYLISAYKFGDLTKVYPVARGTGPNSSHFNFNWTVGCFIFKISNNFNYPDFFWNNHFRFIK